MNVSKKIALIATVFIAATTAYAAKPAQTTKITTAETSSLATIATIDQGEILLGAVASHKKVNSGIADFAKMMIDMHGDNLTQILEMANTLHALPLTSSTADKLHAQMTKEMTTLGGLEGTTFEKAYIDAMVKGHEGALNLIDTQLMKTAKSDEIKKFLTDTRAVVAKHLEDAKKLQKA